MSTGPIGIFDSGFGGLTIFKGIRGLLPEHDYVYLGDNARTPYGNRSFETVLRFTLEGVAHLFGLGCPLVVIACNTASAKALRSIQQQYLPATHPDRRVLGVIRPTVEAVDDPLGQRRGRALGHAGHGAVRELRDRAAQARAARLADAAGLPAAGAADRGRRAGGAGPRPLHRQVLGADPAAGRRRRHAAARVHALPADPAPHRGAAAARGAGALPGRARRAPPRRLPAAPPGDGRAPRPRRPLPLPDHRRERALRPPRRDLHGPPDRVGDGRAQALAVGG